MIGKTKLIATATIAVVSDVLVSQVTTGLAWGFLVGLVVAAIVLTYLSLRWQAKPQEQGPDAIKARLSQLTPELRSQVRERSYGARSKLIEAPLKKLDLDITPRVGLVRDVLLTESEVTSEVTEYDIVDAFESSNRRLLIVGEPGSGKSMAAYSLIEYLEQREGDGRTPLLVEVSAWEAQETFEAFLVDYLCSSVGYQVRQRADASALIDSRRYHLVLDGLDEIPAALRTHFSERLDELLRRLPSEVGVVVTCRTQEYEDLRSKYSSDGLGLVQAVETCPLTDQQLDSAFIELAKLDEEWKTFLSQRHARAYQQVRKLLSNPLFLNLAVIGHLSPGELLDFTTTEQELQDLVLDRYIEHTLEGQRLEKTRHYEPKDARRYLTWIARFLDGDEISPFGLKTSDFTVFDLADLTPPDLPRRYRLGIYLVLGLYGGLLLGLILTLFWGSVVWLGFGLFCVPFFWLYLGTLWPLTVWLMKREVLRKPRPLSHNLLLSPLFSPALSARLVLVWPIPRQRLREFALPGFRSGVYGLSYGLALWAISGKVLAVVLALAVTFILFFRGLVIETRSLLVTSRTPTEASARSLNTALTLGLMYWLVWGLMSGMLLWLATWQFAGQGLGLILTSFFGLAAGLAGGLVAGMQNGGWFVLLQRVAHRRLARAGKLPSRPYDFLEWGIERRILRRVGGGVRFRHNLIQQHLASVDRQVGAAGEKVIS